MPPQFGAVKRCTIIKDQDSSNDVESGEDAVWIDQIVFPPVFSEGGGTSQTGDVNGDGEVSVLDIILIVNIVLDTLEPTADQAEGADLNLDGIINILDVIACVNIILDA